MLVACSGLHYTHKLKELQVHTLEPMDDTEREDQKLS
jgi:hypothetical protein